MGADIDGHVYYLPQPNTVTDRQTDKRQKDRPPGAITILEKHRPPLITYMYSMWNRRLTTTSKTQTKTTLLSGVTVGDGPAFILRVLFYTTQNTCDPPSWRATT